jgi:GT2 family glycosyltransferase
VDRGKIAVVMLACDKAPYVARALESVSAEAGAPLECVLVDNGSGLEVGEAFSRFEEAVGGTHLVKRLRFETNVGAVRGRNEAMSIVESDFVAWVDNDVLARSRGWATALARRLDERADVGIVGPKLVYPWRPQNIQCAGCDVTRTGRVVFRGRDEPRDDPLFNDERDCPALISACWMMRTSLFRELGPLDERFSPVQFEDIDYCYRARRAGHGCLYYPAVEMYHFEGMTTARTEGLSYDRLTAENAVRFKRKWRDMIAGEGGMADADVPRWKRNVGWRPLEEIGRLEVID